jgi:hypothetical protein
MRNLRWHPLMRNLRWHPLMRWHPLLSLTITKINTICKQQFYSNIARILLCTFSTLEYTTTSNGFTTFIADPVGRILKALIA